MQLLYFGVPLIAIGVVLLILSGPFGLIPLALGIGTVVAGYRRPSAEAEHTPDDGPGVGYAHHGQKHMGVE